MDVINRTRKERYPLFPWRLEKHVASSVEYGWMSRFSSIFFLVPIDYAQLGEQRTSLPAVLV